MGNESNGSMQAAPVSKQLHSALEKVLGKDFRSIVKFYNDTPTGLIRDGKLMLNRGSVQTVLIYGELSDKQMVAIKDEFFSQLAQARADNYVPVRLEFYRQEIFERNDQGIEVRGDEELMRSFEFTK